ncbi:hypothetical protein A8B79_08340 [Balneola sp. EhC07]|uniref:DUF423 domain-containing protein n=1 Tax=Balneola sp. EhC07 TaxID=1849360 RepID=UPI0007F55FD2|nr:DUF423 domain-containing protein [Balneola sp. EhC07]OAN61456.1 hypothetical protein A8B79_08340 [Balneola sp. EhC07]
MSNPTILILASFLAALAVGLGAFGAHALEESLSPKRLDTWNTAVTYHMWHALALIGLALVSKVFEVDLTWSLNLIGAGIFVFSGSLYLLCLTDTSWLGAITPIGGICFILGWVLAGWKFITQI